MNKKIHCGNTMEKKVTQAKPSQKRKKVKAQKSSQYKKKFLDHGNLVYF